MTTKERPEWEREGFASEADFSAHCVELELDALWKRGRTSDVAHPNDPDHSCLACASCADLARSGTAAVYLEGFARLLEMVPLRPRRAWRTDEGYVTSRLEELGYRGGFGVADVTWPPGAKPEFWVIGYGRLRGEPLAVCSSERMARLLADLVNDEYVREEDEIDQLREQPLQVDPPPDGPR